jgi:hypothetical protein
LSGLDTILDQRINTSIDFNGLLVPANFTAHHIQTYSNPALFFTKDSEPYSLSRAGSITKLRHKDRYFSLVSSHQFSIGHYDFEQLCIHNTDKKTFSTSNRAFFPKGVDTGESDFDCMLFEFTDAVLDGALSPNGWYNIQRDLGRDKTPRALGCCCVGYPGYRNHIDYENELYTLAPSAVFGKEIEPTLPGRLAFQPINSIEYDPIGMSGGPVFGFAFEGDRVIANLSGILTNASKTRFNFISLQRIKPLFSLALGID